MCEHHDHRLINYIESKYKTLIDPVGGFIDQSIDGIEPDDLELIIAANKKIRFALIRAAIETSAETLNKLAVKDPMAFRDKIIEISIQGLSPIEERTNKELAQWAIEQDYSVDEEILNPRLSSLKACIDDSKHSGSKSLMNITDIAQ